jgi:hypothetical protein
MRSIPVDIARLVMFCVLPPSEKVKNFKTGELAMRDGKTLWQVTVSVTYTDTFGRPAADQMTVTVPGEPKGLAPGMPVQFLNLTADKWARDGREGIAFRADAAQPVPVKG